MEDKLESSVRLLDNALSSTFNKGRSIRFSNTTKFDDSTFLIQNERMHHTKIRKNDIKDLSISIFPGEENFLLDASVTVTESMSVPATNVMDALFSQFQSVYQTLGTTQQIFDAVATYIELITNTVSTIWSGKDLTDKGGNSIRWLLEELNTWRLIFALYKDRTTARNINDDPMETSKFIHCPTSEKEIVADFYYNDKDVREAQIVVDWLETCYKHENKLTSQPSIIHFTDKTVSWENTLCQLNCGTSNFGLQTGSLETVTSLDPDVVYREEGRALHYLDSTSDSRLIKQILREIRSGQLEQAQQLCIHCGQEWRAAVLEGWRLYHDPNYDSNVCHAAAFGESALSKRNSTEREILPVEGNPNRDLWKICAWNMCEDPRASADERAVMGALCGHLSSLLPLCNTWEDQLWAYTRVSIDVAVEQQIRSVSVKSYQPLANSYWNNQRSMEKIIKEIGRKDESFKPNRILQQLVILDQCEELINLSSKWLEEKKQFMEPHFLRYLCHLILVLRALGRHGSAYHADQVISAYVKVLMKLSDCDSVAYYCSLLPEEEQVDLYSTFMERITGNTDRAGCLKAAETYGLNIPLITEKVVHNVRSRKGEDDFDGDFTLGREVTDVDKEKISALDWMVYYPHQRAESIWECNALIRTFIGQGKLSAARLAFDRIPSDSVEIILQQYCTTAKLGTVERGALPPKVDAAIKEHLCYKAYLDAQEGFSRWFHNFHNKRPAQPNGYEGSDFTERVAQEHRMIRYKEEYSRWKNDMLHETKVVRALLFNVITFPDGGWLVDDYEEDETRTDNMQRLRGLCIPQIFLLLHKVLHSMELYEEAVDLITVLMDESTGYYEIFNRTQLSDMTVKVSESCDALLANSLDPFGWENGDTIDMVDDAESLNRGTSPFQPNLDATLEEIPGIENTDSNQDNEELINAWEKMADNYNFSRTYDFQLLRDTREVKNSEDEDDESL